MVIVRPVHMEDLEDLVSLANKETFGLTSLPKDAQLLKSRILESLYSFQKPVEKPGGELYIFVMEDLDTGRVIGTSCIVSKVGGFQPFYTYRIAVSLHESKSLGIRKEVPTLHLVREHSGPAEIGGLLLAPEYRRHGNGRLLSLFRFLFMAEFRRRFEPVVIAEMRGILDGEGNSAFWEAVGRHFFDMDYPSADLLSAMDKKFIADLMPTSPIYIPLLPRSAQDVIGKVHRQTEPALKLLRSEGFQFFDMVDIFEGGPVIRCRINDIRIVRESRKATVLSISHQDPERPSHLISVPGEEFRSCTGTVSMDRKTGARVTIPESAGVGLHVGDMIRFAPLRPSKTSEEIP